MNEMKKEDYITLAQCAIKQKVCESIVEMIISLDDNVYFHKKKESDK